MQVEVGLYDTCNELTSIVVMMQINPQEKPVELTHGRVDRPLVGVCGEGVDGLLVRRLKGPHVVEEGGGHVGVLHQVEVGARVEGQQALQVRYQPALKKRVHR